MCFQLTRPLLTKVFEVDIGIYLCPSPSSWFLEDRPRWCTRSRRPRRVRRRPPVAEGLWPAELEEKINVVLVLNLKWKNIYCCSLMSSMGWEKVLCSRFKPKVAELTNPLSCGRPIFTCVNYSRITIIRHQISHRMICGNSKVVHSM